MTRGYWDRDGFHEGPMPAADFGGFGPLLRAAASADAGRYQSGRPSGQVANSPQPTVDFGDAHTYIVNPDGSVSGIDRSPSLYWCNNIQTPPVAPIPDPSPQVDNSGQPVIGFPRGGCNSPARASRHSLIVGRMFPVNHGESLAQAERRVMAQVNEERAAEWAERELGDVTVRPFLDAPWHRPVAEFASSTVGAIE